MRRTSTLAFFRHFAFLLLSLGLLLTRTPGQAQTLPASEGLVADSTELRVLRQLYYTTGGPQWTTATNWLQGTTLAEVATWAGVGVGGGDVTSLALVNNHLQGSLPPSLSRLQGLLGLRLDANQLTGPLPAALGQLTRLQLLSVASNQLTGALPAELGNLTQLGSFDASTNQLTGPLPARLGNWARVEWLAITGNQLTGPIPASWGRLAALQYLLLDHNQLSGPLPDSLGDCAQLRYVRLGVNHLTGPLPARWGQLTHLNHLWLAGNALAGPLPAELTQLHELNTLGLDNNQLSGPLPEHLEGLTALSNLDLSGNQFTGPLPASFGQLPALGYCTLAHNQFTGPLPAPVGGGWQRLGYLDLSQNDFSGSLPDSLGQCSALTGLNLSYNHFSGPLPAALGRCRNLRDLRLEANQLQGPLPASWGQLPLYYLIAHHNQLSGPIPRAWQRFPQLGGLDLSFNRLTGTVPDSLKIEYLLLNDNRLDSVSAGYAAHRWNRQLLVHNNHLRQLPSFLGLAELDQLTVWAGGNYLDFASLEANWQPAQRGTPGPGWSLNPNELLPPVGDTLAATQGQAAGLTGRIGGTRNHYQWQRWVGGQWVNLPGQTGETVRWAAVTAAETGTYRTQVTNDWVTGVALSSRPHYLDVTPYAPLAQNRPVDANQGLVIQRFEAPDSANWHSAAAPADMNYVRVWTPRVALTDTARVPRARVDSVSMRTQYLDGLGRPVQTVLKQASPARRDMVQPQAYDGLGREPLAYLPYPNQQNGDGGYRPQALQQQHAFYYPSLATGPPTPDDPTRGVARTGRAYAETLFEASPLNRVTAQGAAGEAWQVSAGHEIERVERPNTAADSVLWFVPGYDPQSLDPGYRGFYAAGELWGTDVSDAHGPSTPGGPGYRTIEWKDKLGQVVCKQVEAARTGTTATGLRSRWLRTCYVYDDFQHLRFVLQPEASKLLGTPAPRRPGTLTREQWDNVPGNAVQDIPLPTPPSRVQVLTALEGPANVGDNYGDRIRGFLVAPQTGDYDFWLAGDDNCEFWLSADADPANARRLALVSSYTSPRQWTAADEQHASKVALVAGQRYYLQVLHKQGGGPSHVAVTWQLPDGSGYGSPIAGQYLLPYQSSSGSVQPYLFHYRYDGRGRQIAKQVPGQDGETLVVYDQLDRPVLSQDAQQRTRREWSWTKYDALGRIVLSGLVTRADTLGQVSLQAIATADTATAHQYEQRTADAATYPQLLTTDQSFPKLGQQGFGRGQVLSVTRYDDYDYNGDGQADVAYDASTDGQFPSGTAPVADALRTTGLVTQTQTRVLGVADNDPTQAAWLTTTTFYDERARPVQVQTSNARKYGDHQQGRDLLTTRLDFTGQVVQSVAVHQGPSHDPLQVAEFFTYDHTGRLLTTRQQLPGEARPALLDSISYNEVGQAVRKTLGTGRLRQDVDYAYNIRGWLTRVNDPYFPLKDRLFNLSLHYETGFTKDYEQYNGNLTGQTWRGRDGVQRAYGYVYDPLNRLLQGDFVARQPTSAVTPGAGAWKGEEDNYRLSFVSYDDNGNILTLRRRGLLQNATHAHSKQYGAVDNLSYAYQGNRLLSVDDAVTGNQLPRPKNYNGAPTSLAGDFQEQGVKLGQEYLYDANGNLTQDKNKGITGIVYNHLNLPRQIHFGQVGDSVVFRYAASGQKVAKLVYQTGKATPLRTDYLGPYQYEQDSLKFFPHAEGRVLRFVSGTSGAVSYQREFTLKDHLGNLRLAYRLGQVRTLTATLEQDANTHQRESKQFDSLSVSPPVAVATRLARSGGWAAKLNAGGASPQPLGPLTQLGVQKSDTVTVTAYGTYPQAQQHGFLFSLAAFITNLVHPASPPPTGPEVGQRKELPLLQVGLAAGLASLPQLSGGVPQGYLRLLVFNKDSLLLQDQCRVVQLTQAANGGYEQLRLQVVLPQDGYVTAYVGSQSDVDVFFDDVQVEHRPGLQVQENQYEPWGLSLTGVDYGSPGIQESNNYLFNGKQNYHDLGLNIADYGARLYDSQLGQWKSIDIKSDKFCNTSGYVFSNNNPIFYVDPDGKEIVPSITTKKDGTVVFQLTITGKLINESTNKYSQQQLNEFASRLSNAIESYYSSANDPKHKFEVNVQANITAESGTNMLTKSDHAFRVRDDGRLEDPTSETGFIPAGLGVLGIGFPGENVVYLSADVLAGQPAMIPEAEAGTGRTNEGNGTLERTGSHELGHSAGLAHPYVGAGPYGLLPLVQGMRGPGQTTNNLMNQTGTPDAGTKISKEQLMLILQSYQNGELNHGKQNVH